MGTDNGQPAASRSGLLGVLDAPSQNGSYERDIRLVARAVYEDWPMSESVRTELVGRLMKVVNRESVLIPAGDGGSFDSEAVADRNAVAAAAVLRAMHDKNRDVAIKAAEFGQTERFQRKAGGSTTNILVLNIPPPRALEAAESPQSP